MAQLLAQSYHSRCFHALHMVLGVITLPPKMMIFASVFAHVKDTSGSRDVFVMLCYWFSHQSVASILIFLPKLKNSSHLDLLGKAASDVCRLEFAGVEQSRGMSLRNLS